MLKKICGFCKEEFETDTSKAKNVKYCSQKCVRKSECIRSKRWRDTNQEKDKATRRRYYNKNPLKCKKMWQNWIGTNRERFNLKHKEYYDKNKEIDLIRKRDYNLIKKEECVLCWDKKDLTLHHISYKPSISMVLCNECHLKKHGKVSRNVID